MIDKGFVDHCLELLAPLGATRAKRMFSGYGLYIDELCVALILRDTTLYLKTDDASRPAFVDAGCKPFTYETRKGERAALGYYTAPEETMESPAEMLPWARRALAAAVAARAKAPARKKAAATAGGKSVAGKKAAAKAPANKAAAKTPATKAAPAQAPVKVAAKAPAKGTAAARKATPAPEAAAQKAAAPARRPVAKKAAKA